MSNDQPVLFIRETATCRSCGLQQYLTESGRCKRCSQALGIEFFKLPLGKLSQQSIEELRRPLPFRIGSLLLTLRSRRGFSQKALASAAGTSRSYVSRMENGHVLPPILTLLRVMTALGLETIVLRFENAESLPHPKFGGPKPG